jgi:glycosyltransferase involved in cell wall biosynthesis
VIRVLHLVTWLEHGGLERWLLDMLEAIPRDAIRMDFCCKGGSVGTLAPLAERRGARVFHCPLRPDHLGFAAGLGRVIRDGGYHVLHNHLEAYSGVGTWIGRRAGVPVITSFHNTEFPPQTWTRLPALRRLRTIYAALSRRYAVRRSHYVTGCSGAVLVRMLPRRAGRARGRVLYYGVTLRPRAAGPDRAALRSAMGWPVESPVIAHVGRMIEQKNHQGLLDVFRRVRTLVPGARLLCVGDGPLRGAVERRIAREGLGDHARCVGLRGDAVDLLARSDLLLLPSRHEGLALVALEAGAVGLPVVGSRIPGLDEVVLDGETGALHDVDDVDAMAGSTVRILTAPAVAARLGEAARRRVRDHFSTRASAARLEGLYRECAGLG